MPIALEISEWAGKQYKSNKIDVEQKIKGLGLEAQEVSGLNPGN